MGHYFLKHPNAKIIDLNKMMSTWGARQAKFKEGDLLISKKRLQNLEKVNTYQELTSLEQFRNYLRKIIDIKSDQSGEIFYLLDGDEKFIKEEIININYIINYSDNIWKYYKQKKEEETYLEANPPIKRKVGRPKTKRKAGRPKKIVKIAKK